ncbi:MAG TPA: ribonuclease HII [Bacteroidales bacterium]|nr:ribonuclease HII [Bacteroidales bacterium]
MLKPRFDSAAIVQAGCDEAGRGCLAGPVTAAAVILPPDFSHPLLNDSKQLTARQRENLREIIIDQAQDYAIAHVSVEEIDAINILNASFLAMHRAIEKLAVVPELLLIDGNRFKPFAGIPHQCIIHGDAIFMAIAAASILAKTERDRLMVNLHAQYPHYQWYSNKGYPTEAHRRAILDHGLTEHHRKSFNSGLQLRLPL